MPKGGMLRGTLFSAPPRAATRGGPRAGCACERAAGTCVFVPTCSGCLGLEVLMLLVLVVVVLVGSEGLLGVELGGWSVG